MPHLCSFVLTKAPIRTSQFTTGGDLATAALLRDVILPEEITHVAYGLKWFRFLQPAHQHTGAAAAAAGNDEIVRFRALVREYFHGGALRGPFNDHARASAGMTPEYYVDPTPA